MLEWNLSEAKTTINSLQMDLQEHQKYSANLQVQLETYENKCKKLEKSLKIWKTTSTVLVVILSSIVIYKYIGEKYE